MGRPRRRAVGAVVALSLAATVPVSAEERRYADFVYVDANEGSASGGHVALRLGDRTYHFGHHEPGVLRLDRDESDRFAHVYSALENRNLEILRIEVSAETFGRLRSSFNERYLTEEQEFRVVDGLIRDRALLEDWRDGEATVAVPGAGYFEATDGSSDSPLDRLRARVARRYGGDVVARRRAAAREELFAAGEIVAARVPPLAAASRHPPAGYGPHDRAVDAAALLMALSVLEDGASLRGEAVVEVAADGFVLDAPLRGALARVAEQIEDDLVDSMASRRPDVGVVLLVGMARLLALEATLEGDRLVVLDVLPPDAVALSVDEIRARGGRLEPLADELRDELPRVRQVLVRKPVLREADYAALEALVNRHAEIERSRAHGTPLRVARGTLVPVRAAPYPLEPLGDASREALDARVHELASRERALRERLDRTHHYHLLGHNCVSELFAQIERAVLPGRVVGSGSAEVERASTDSLGGYIEPGRGLDFIPFRAADRVGATYRLAEQVRLPSHRRRALMAMGDHGTLTARLRESNVITSTVYAPNVEDSAFLFFTDDVVAARPLLGAANLMYGLGAALVGLPQAPLDGGRSFASGLRGAFWSLPELAFWNVRKGSYFYAPRAASLP